MENQQITDKNSNQNSHSHHNSHQSQNQDSHYHHHHHQHQHHHHHHHSKHSDSNNNNNASNQKNEKTGSNSRSRSRDIQEQTKKTFSTQNSENAKKISLNKNKSAHKDAGKELKNKIILKNTAQTSNIIADDEEVVHYPYKLQPLARRVKFFMSENMPRLKYEPTPSFQMKKDIIHWGQRKLFISELMFLTRYGDLAQNIVYAGAACGTHIPYLAYLFPNHNFTLIDPCQFSLRQDILDKEDYDKRIHIFQEYFDDEFAKKFVGQDILFICDIRTANSEEAKKVDDKELQKQLWEKHEDMVIKDMEVQERWCRIMTPKKSLLKFRCPYTTTEVGQKEFKTLKGKIYMQAWCPPSSSETRLIPEDNLEVITYDPFMFEDIFYYHNQRIRHQDVNVIKEQIVKGQGLKEQWDCAVEVLILCQFLQKFPQYQDKFASDDIIKSISLMSEEISKKISEPNKYRDLTMHYLEDPDIFKANLPVVIDHTAFHYNKEQQTIKNKELKANQETKLKVTAKTDPDNTQQNCLVSDIKKDENANSVNEQPPATNKAEDKIEEENKDQSLEKK